MSVYKISFVNNSSNAAGQDFTLYTAPPVVQSSAGPVLAWSNALLTKTVVTGARWPITVSGTPYGFCGVASQRQLAPGTTVDATMISHATVGTQSPGSTFDMYNVGGDPAFKDYERFTAPARAYEIDTSDDFTANFKWVAGYALSTGRGEARPATTFSVANNTQYIVSPPEAPKFHLGQFKSSAGSLVDTSAFVNSTEIDFAQYPGQPYAQVTLENDGIFHVEFMTAPVFAMSTAGSAVTTQNSSVQLTQLKHQVKIMSDLIDTALGVSASAGFDPTVWECSFDWTKEIPDRLRYDVATRMRANMESQGYKFKSQRIRPKLSITFSHPTKKVRSEVIHDWIKAWTSLPDVQKPLLIRPNVEKIYFIQGDSSSVGQLEASEVELPVLRPDYECSLEWLEGPNEQTQKAIAYLLAKEMEDQEYIPFSPKIDDKSLAIPVWHADSPSVETVRAAWLGAVDNLHKLFLGNYVHNPQVEGIAYPDSSGGPVPEPTLNGQASAQIFPPNDPGYACSLRWLEGPSKQVKMSILAGLREQMTLKGYKFLQQKPLDRCEIWFSHVEPSTLDQAKIDWIDAYNSLGFQRMYVTGPIVEPLFGPAAGDAAPTPASPGKATYDFSLTWLEGADPGAKTIIINKLVFYLSYKGYTLQGLPVNIGDELHLILSHDEPTSLEIATVDWVAAANTLGTQRMFVGNLRCEHAPQIAANGDASAVSLLPPKYTCSLLWARNPPQEAQSLVMSSMIKSMIDRGYILAHIYNDTQKFAATFYHQLPSDLVTATADWQAAYQSLPLPLKLIAINPQTTPATNAEVGNVSLSEINLDDSAAPAESTIGTNGTGAQAPDPLFGIESAGPAPDVTASASMRSETIEEKKRRALELLQREGLVGISGISSLA